MAYRKWLIRLLLLAVLASAGGGYYLYERWTNPAAVRAAVLSELSQRFPGAIVQLRSARLRLFGGVYLKDLQLTCRDEASATPFASFPTLILFHDKEQLNHGKLVIGKIRVPQPQMRLIRRKDGSWNLSGIIAPGKPVEPLPPIEIEAGTLTFIDHAAPEAAPVEIRDLHMTVSPGENGLVHFSGAGQSDLVGEARLDGTTNLTTGETVLTLQLPAVRIDRPLLTRLGTYAPELAQHAHSLAGPASLQMDLGYHPQQVGKFLVPNRSLLEVDLEMILEELASRLAAELREKADAAAGMKFAHQLVRLVGLDLQSGKPEFVDGHVLAFDVDMHTRCGRVFRPQAIAKQFAGDPERLSRSTSL